MNRRLIGLALFGLASAAAAASLVGQDGVEVLTINFVRESIDGGRTTVIEEGTFTINDGVFRVDRMNKRTQKRSSEITDLKARTRTTIDDGKASTQSMTTLPPLQVVPGPQPTGRGTTVDLGTKQVDGNLVLHGSRHSFTTVRANGVEQTHILEGWMLRGNTPVLLEMRSEVIPGGILDEQRIVSVQRETKSRSIFQP
jgi:hypothetical protein